MNPKENRIDRDMRRLGMQIDEDRVFDYARRAEFARKAQQILHEASTISRSRPRDQEARASHPTPVSLCHATVAAAYPQGFGQDFRRLKEGNASGITAAVKFLEADPWFFRSGYTKAELIRYLIRIALPRDIEDRLRLVVLAVVDHGDRREFRYYCRLARKVDSPELRRELSKRIQSEVPSVARWHAGYSTPWPIRRSATIGRANLGVCESIGLKFPISAFANEFHPVDPVSRVLNQFPDRIDRINRMKSGGLGVSSIRPCLTQRASIRRTQLKAAAAIKPAIPITPSMTSATPERWLSTPVWSKPQRKIDIGWTPGSRNCSVTGSSPRPRASATSQDAKIARKERGKATRHILPNGPYPSRAAASR